MPKLRAHNIAVSLEGYMAGPDQRVEEPLGTNGERLHDWVFETQFGREMIGETGGDTGVDHDYMLRGVDNIGAHIMGRNMFGPVRGEWPDDSWKGWWGDEPPYHHPVFVLTHHAREPQPMEGGTTFYFVDDRIEAVLERAFDAAGGADVRLGGGASTIRQYMKAGLLDELHLAIVPILLGSGERPVDDLGAAADGYECVEHVTTESVTHVVLARR